MNKRHGCGVCVAVGRVEVSGEDVCEEEAGGRVWGVAVDREVEPEARECGSVKKRQGEGCVFEGCLLRPSHAACRL